MKKDIKETYFGLSKDQIMHIISSYMDYTNFVELIDTGAPDPKTGKIYTLFGESEIDPDDGTIYQAYELFDSWWDEYIDDERDDQKTLTDEAG
tara:strand:+ start:181 stop:459 length:279 start_codon:yes stop_codon:yes gene_type:complete